MATKPLSWFFWENSHCSIIFIDLNQHKVNSIYGMLILLVT